MTNTPKGFAADADTMIAIVEAMHALTAAIADVLKPEQKEDMAQSLAMQARKAEETGDQILETLLIDLHRTIKA